MTSPNSSQEQLKRDNSELHHGIYVLTGYGLRIAVERGHLVVEDGLGKHRRRESFSRVDDSLKRLVVIGSSGMITLDAIAWLQGVGVPLINLAYDGRLVFVSSPAALTVAQLRRAQAQAADTERGLRIGRGLLVAKLEGQEALLDMLPDGEEARLYVSEMRTAAERAPTLLALRDSEARAARTYWRVWRKVPLQFVRADGARRPRHWQLFGSRISPLTDPSPRKAVNPANAVLNYLYAILEAEATIAALGARLDPALGVVHADRPDRASLACDIMEPVRPAVDAFALSLFRDRPFTKDDVFELGDGHCRLLPCLTHELAATAPLWAERVGPVADQVARALVTLPRKKATIVPGVPMPRQGLRKKAPRSRTNVVRNLEGALPVTWADLWADAGSAWAGMRAFRRVKDDDRLWDRLHGPSDRAAYRTEILPKLGKVPLRHLVAVTGMSTTTCHLIRRGSRIPHPRHWRALRELVTNRSD